MDENSTTPAGNDPSDDADLNSTTVTDSDAGTGQGTGDDANNSDPSKSTDTNAADGDKPEAGDEGANGTPATFDEDLDSWVEKRNLPAATDEAQKRAYQDMRNEQRDFTRNRQAQTDAGDLDKTIRDAKKGLKTAEDDEDLTPVEQRLAALEADKNAQADYIAKSEVYTREKVTPEEHKVVLDIFKEKVERQSTNEGKLKAVDLWGSSEALPDLLDLARARIAKGMDTSLIEDKAAREEREKIAKESQAKSPNRNATNHNPSDKTPEQERVDRLKARYSSTPQ
jgi:hypothetical protein